MSPFIKQVISSFAPSSKAELTYHPWRFNTHCGPAGKAGAEFLPIAFNMLVDRFQ